MTEHADAPTSAVLPNFVVIGAMRSGSTSLYKYLQAHPDVFMPRKEIHFFDRKWDRGLSWYHTRFEGYSRAARHRRGHADLPRRAGRPRPDGDHDP